LHESLVIEENDKVETVKKHIKIILSFGLISVFTACGLLKPSKTQQSSIAQVEKQAGKFKVLGTKGSGEPPIYGYQDYEANTVGSIRNALQQLDGVEVDLQMSSDGSFWLFEDHQLKDCRSLSKNFAAINDVELNLASRCWHKNQLVPLDTMISQLKGQLTSEKTVSFDLRFLNNNVAVEALGRKKEATKAVINKFREYLKGQQFSVILQVGNDSIYPLLKKESDYPVYHHQTNDKKFDEKGSFIYSIEILKNSSNKKNKSKDYHISEVNTPEDAFYAIEKGASYIQTPDVVLGAFLKKINKGSLKDSLLFGTTAEHVDENKEKLLLATVELKDLDNNFLLNFQLDSTSAERGIFLIYSGENISGDELTWDGRAVASDVSYWQLMDIEVLKEKGVESIKVYLSNQNKLNFQIKNMKLKILTY